MYRELRGVLRGRGRLKGRCLALEKKVKAACLKQNCCIFFKPFELSNCNSMLGLSLGVFLKAQFFEPQLMWSWSSCISSCCCRRMIRALIIEHVVTRRLRLHRPSCLSP